jgi:hypothetical protein
VGRALEALGITLITAHSPQAKGRVERCWGTLQDRMVKELRRAGACTIDETNAVLATFLPRYRARFARPAADPACAYRAPDDGIDLDAVCSFHYVRVANNDNIVRLEERIVQLPPGRRGGAMRGARWTSRSGSRVPCVSRIRAPSLRSKNRRRRSFFIHENVSAGANCWPIRDLRPQPSSIRRTSISRPTSSYRAPPSIPGARHLPLGHETRTAAHSRRPVFLLPKSSLS